MEEMTAKEVRSLLKSFDVEQTLVLRLLEHRSLDVRQAAQKFLDKKAAEERRLYELSFYERALYAKGIQLIAGVDEVGRGPLCGPVMAGAVVLPPDCLIFGINDSKKLSEKVRLELEKEIKAKALFWAVAGVNHREIDKHNIRQATLMAMKKALGRLSVFPEHVLVDAETLPDLPVPQTAIVRGDALSVSIAAASILAKNHRDRVMKIFAQTYPQYGLENNKGYGSKEHCAAIADYGLSPIHRRSFSLKNL